MLNEELRRALVDKVCFKLYNISCSYYFESGYFLRHKKSDHSVSLPSQRTAEEWAAEQEEKCMQLTNALRQRDSEALGRGNSRRASIADTCLASVMCAGDCASAEHARELLAGAKQVICMQSTV